MNNTPMWVGDKRGVAGGSGGDGESDLDRWTSQVTPHAAKISEVSTVQHYSPPNLEICCNMCESSSDRRSLMGAIDSTRGTCSVSFHPECVCQAM